MDPPDSGEDRSTATVGRYPRLRQRRTFAPSNGFLTACEPQADCHQLQSRPQPAVPLYFLSSHPLSGDPKRVIFVVNEQCTPRRRSPRKDYRRQNVALTISTFTIRPSSRLPLRRPCAREPQNAILCPRYRRTRPRSDRRGVYNKSPIRRRLWTTTREAYNPHRRDDRAKATVRRLSLPPQH